MLYKERLPIDHSDLTHFIFLNYIKLYFVVSFKITWSIYKVIFPAQKIVLQIKDLT